MILPKYLVLNTHLHTYLLTYLGRCVHGTFLSHTTPNYRCGVPARFLQRGGLAGVCLSREGSGGVGWIRTIITKHRHIILLRTNVEIGQRAILLCRLNKTHYITSITSPTYRSTCFQTPKHGLPLVRIRGKLHPSPSTSTSTSERFMLFPFFFFFKFHRRYRSVIWCLELSSSH